MSSLESARRVASPVRVSIPFDVAADLGNFKKAVGSVLGKLGCQACCSGFDIHFEIERAFFVGSDLQVKGLAQSAGAMRSAAIAGPGRTFVLDDAVANKQASLFKLIDRIGNVGGCNACCSGFDLHFETGKSFLINAKAEAVGLV